MAKPLHQSTTSDTSASIVKSTAVSGTQKLALGAGFFAMFFAQQSVSVLAIPFYQMTLGVDPFLLGLALTLPLLLGTLLGPWVGHLSDHHQSRFGRRRPFILVASWACCLFFGLIWMVPTGWGELAHLLYFVIFSLLFYVAVTFMSVPMTCLSYEMSPDYHQRTEIDPGLQVDEWTCKRILGHRIIGLSWKFLTEWEGAEDSPTWEPPGNFVHRYSSEFVKYCHYGQYINQCYQERDY